MAKENGTVFLEEYKLCQNTTQNIESTIWKTGGVIGIGAVGSLITLAVSYFEKIKEVECTQGIIEIEHLIPAEVIIALGFLIIMICWIWWGMAKRWWDIQHNTFLRMSHIEEELDMYQIRYHKFKDNILDITKSTLSKDKQEQIMKDSHKFKKRGVQKSLFFLPILITISWTIFGIYLMFT